ncbi:MAG TPA: hypothetical protein VFK73_04870 [Paludibacter sp.]|nr:hypothetical protein [Paludibacter sp.]
MSNTLTKNEKNHKPIAHAYIHWLADVHSGSFAPALASLIFNSLCPLANGQRMLPPSADGQMP